VVRRNEADRHDVLGGNNGGLSSHRDDRVEISRGQSVGKVAEIVGEKCSDQSKVGAQCRLKQVALSVDVDLLFAFLDDSADAGELTPHQVHSHRPEFAR